MLGFRGAIREVKAGEQGRRRYPLWANPPGSGRDLGLGQGQQRGGHTVTGNGGRHRHATQGTETTSGGWWVAGAGDVQVGGASLQERNRVAGATQREGYGNKHLLMGGISMD